MEFKHNRRTVVVVQGNSNYYLDFGLGMYTCSTMMTRGYKPARFRINPIDQRFEFLHHKNKVWGKDTSLAFYNKVLAAKVRWNSKYKMPTLVKANNEWEGDFSNEQLVTGPDLKPKVIKRPKKKTIENPCPECEEAEARPKRVYCGDVCWAAAAARGYKRDSSTVPTGRLETTKFGIQNVPELIRPPMVVVDWPEDLV